MAGGAQKRSVPLIFVERRVLRKKKRTIDRRRRKKTLHMAQIFMSESDDDFSAR